MKIAFISTYFTGATFPLMKHLSDKGNKTDLFLFAKNGGRGTEDLSFDKAIEGYGITEICRTNRIFSYLNPSSHIYLVPFHIVRYRKLLVGYISEFKNSFKTIMNSLNIPITNSEVNSIISGKTSIDEFENKIKNEYGTEYEESKKILNSVDLSQCGENYENCIKEAYNYVKDNNIINNNTSTISESDKEKINSFINSYINKRDIS